ncbi:MAG: hypothetical protein IPG11_18145 [Flavobacteriales bacterium]|nr:hypothetical protein [Flavobacteriales bacterium]
MIGQDRLIDEIWDSGLGLSAAFSNWDEYYLYRDEQDQYDQGYTVEDYQAYYSYQYCQWRQVVTIGGRSSVLMQTKRSHERINVYISRRHMTTGERIYERVSRNLKQRPGYFDGMGTEMASGFMETLHLVGPCWYGTRHWRRGRCRQWLDLSGRGRPLERRH